MRQPNGRMSKKDRRALLAFGLEPVEPVVPAVWPNPVWTNAAPITFAVDPSRQNGNLGLWMAQVNGQTVLLHSGDTLQVTWTVNT